MLRRLCRKLQASTWKSAVKHSTRTKYLDSPHNGLKNYRSLLPEAEGAFSVAVAAAERVKCNWLSYNIKTSYPGAEPFKL